ncbi:autophagy protein 5 [Daktulosphaira vitifoliae]|uniref:autophagy protein 5 n=1 Tax=Daktulosphaira vitifoliae TaxID=58002 RepID=UPI0021AADE17|nr:autophagy protein 5 [Daktulosphaira vitifoliae]
MANDTEILHHLWNGKLAVCFQLNEQEIHGLQNPEPIYLMVPRMSYFPLVCDKVKKHFVKHIDPEKQELEMWLEYNNTPLKWNYPIGVLYDLFIFNDRPVNLPWLITVHFDNFPEDQLIRCSCREVIESNFMSCLKEADTLKHKSQIFSTMQKHQHNQLWNGLINDKFDQFWSENKKLMEPTDGACFKHIPIHFYHAGSLVMMQSLVKPLTEDGNYLTLNELVQTIYPLLEKYNIFTHGICIPSNTPVQWMSEHMSYLDNFLHLIIV